MNSSANTTATVSTGFPYLSLAFKRLCWKEARQIAPLAIALLSISLLLHLLPVSSSTAELQGFHILLLNLIPCLFAIGAGALLVSQEKEQRTIGWLSSLPIASSQILRAKLYVSFAGLAIVWLACLLTTLIFDRELPRELVLPSDGGSSVALTLLNSIFLMFVGMATAWRWQSPLVSLAMIVPLATLPTVAVLTTQGLSQENRLSDFFIGLIYLLFIGAFFWYGWRSGQASLVSKPEWLVWQNLLTKFERPGSRGNLLSAKPQGLASTLLWQFTVQNRMLPIAVVAMFVLPFIAFLLRFRRDDMPLIAIPAWLIASWLGASVFQSDSIHQRIKFLAERGVAPQTIWWTRQIIPFGLIVIAAAIAALLGREILNSGLFAQNRPSQFIPVMLLGIPVVLLVHAAAQWQGQLIRSSIVSLIVAPAITLGAIGYVGFAISTLGAPYWMVFIPIVIAFVATRVMTGPWMDGRTGLKYWLGQGAFLLAALGILALPLLLTAATYPRIPSSVYQKFEAESKAYGVSGNPIELVLVAKPFVAPELELSESGGVGLEGIGELSPEDAKRTEDPSSLGTVAPERLGSEASSAMAAGGGGEAAIEQPVLGFVEQIKRNVDYIEEQLSQRSGPVRWSRAVSFLASEAMLTRAQLDMEPTNEKSRDRYRTAMRILHEVVTRMRLSGRLTDQEGADRIERWMIQQVRTKDARETLGESNWAAITKTLADKAGRMAARRRAIVQSWAYARSANGQLELGGMPMATATGLAGWRAMIADHRRVSRVSWLLLQYLESKDQSEADKRFAEVASAWGLPAIRNSQGGLSLETGFQIPGQNWFGDWENYR